MEDLGLLLKRCKHGNLEGQKKADPLLTSILQAVCLINEHYANDHSSSSINQRT